MVRLTKRETLVVVISTILLGPLVAWGVLFLLRLFFDEPDDPLERAAGSDETTIRPPR
jgi:hypothetical protein